MNLARWSLLALLVLPWACIHIPQVEVASTPPEPLASWNASSLPWSTAIIWVERPNGITLTTGVLVDKEKRLVLATRHAVEKPGSPTEMDRIYVVWPDADSQGEMITTSDHYFQKRRTGNWQPARVLRQDTSRDVVLLEATLPPPTLSRAVPLALEHFPAGQALQGVAQPFTRGALWHPFQATIQDSTHRRLSYSPADMRQPVLLYVAQGQQPFEFGYSGSPLVHPSTGQLVGLLLAAQLDQPHSYVLISSQELLQFLPIE
ncbi:MAG: trypsin-like peptidase domain-containing protein [Gemmatales bacterium]